jgi:hypothetical protein
MLTVPAPPGPGYSFLMATLLDHVPVDQVKQARETRPLRPGRLLLTLFLGIFFVLGWLAGRFWLLAGDCVNSMRIGYWRGKGLDDAEIARKLKPAPAPAPG